MFPSMDDGPGPMILAKNLLIPDLMLSNLMSCRWFEAMHQVCRAAAGWFPGTYQKYTGRRGRELPHLSVMAQRGHFSGCLDGKGFVYTGDNSQL